MGAAPPARGFTPAPRPNSPFNCYKAQSDTVVWFASPKGSSKRYRCEFNRDTGWAVLGQLGFEGVRQVAINEDWSALRFRRVEFIRTMTRDRKRALAETGQARVAPSSPETSAHKP